MRHLAKNGIDSRPFFIPMHQLPIYKYDAKLPIAEKLSLQGINLPSYPQLCENDILYITSKVNEFITQ